MQDNVRNPERGEIKQSVCKHCGFSAEEHPVRHQIDGKYAYCGTFEPVAEPVSTGEPQPESLSVQKRKHYMAGGHASDFIPIREHDSTVTDGFGSEWPLRCEEDGCDGINQVMRPGSVQCSKEHLHNRAARPSGPSAPHCPECKTQLRDETAWYCCDTCHARYSSSMERGLYRLPDDRSAAPQTSAEHCRHCGQLEVAHFGIPRYCYPYKHPDWKEGLVFTFAVFGQCPWCPHHISLHVIDHGSMAEPTNCKECKCEGSIEGYYRSGINPYEHGIDGTPVLGDATNIDEVLKFCVSSAAGRRKNSLAKSARNRPAFHAWKTLIMPVGVLSRLKNLRKPLAFASKVTFEDFSGLPAEAVGMTRESLQLPAAPGSVPQAPDQSAALRTALEALAQDYKEEVRNAEASFAYMNAMEVLGVPQAEPPKEEKP